MQKMDNLDGEGGRWDDFEIALEAFNDMIEEQKEALKVGEEWTWMFVDERCLFTCPYSLLSFYDCTALIGYSGCQFCDVLFVH